MSDTTTSTPRRIGRARALLADKREVVLHVLADTRMSRHDAALWRAARTFGDLGELVAGWLHGDPEWTPGHGGGPCEETLPLIPFLAEANRAGFITDNSQLAETWDDHTSDTWVSGFASDETLARLRAAVAGTPLRLVACRDRVHGERHTIRSTWRCAWRDTAGFWADACPHVAGDIRASWYVRITDPEPGRNHILWPALERFAWSSRYGNDQ